MAISASRSLPVRPPRTRDTGWAMSPVDRKTPRRWLYRGGRPHRLASALNRLQTAIASAGLPPHRVQALEVRGRRTGRLITFPVVVADYRGHRYLVAMLGEGANWVANVRAGGGRAVLRHGHREPVRLEEVEERERAPILKRYLALAPGARAHFPVGATAALPEFEALAPNYPVFRVEVSNGDPQPAE